MRRLPSVCERNGGYEIALCVRVESLVCKPAPSPGSPHSPELRYQRNNFAVRNAAKGSKLNLLNLQPRSGPLNLLSAFVQLHPF